MLEAKVKLPTGNEGTIRHIFNKQEEKTTFDYIKPDKSNEKFPGGFGRELSKKYIPALRDVGIKEINIQASSSHSAGMNGGYTWCFYGFTNKKMKDTLQSYVSYIKDYHNVYLDGKEINAIVKISRMNMLLKENHAEDFLKAKYRGNMSWDGVIRDINSENTIEMKELIEYLREEDK